MAVADAGSDAMIILSTPINITRTKSDKSCPLRIWTNPSHTHVIKSILWIYRRRVWLPLSYLPNDFISAVASGDAFASSKFVNNSQHLHIYMNW